jgi:hypothetical protein
VERCGCRSRNGILHERIDKNIVVMCHAQSMPQLMYHHSIPVIHEIQVGPGSIPSIKVQIVQIRGKGTATPSLLIRPFGTCRG